MTEETAITKTSPQPLATPARREQAQPLTIVQHDAPLPQYQTAKSRGLPAAPVTLPKLPNILSLTLSAIIALSFLVAASMFSIGLTAYSNSVDRVDRDRSYMRVD